MCAVGEGGFGEGEGEGGDSWMCGCGEREVSRSAPHQARVLPGALGKAVLGESMQAVCQNLSGHVSPQGAVQSRMPWASACAWAVGRMRGPLHTPPFPTDPAPMLPMSPGHN